MLNVCVIADCVDDQYAGIYTYATELIAALERMKPAHMHITYVHFRENDFFAGKNEWIIPLKKRFPGSSTWRKFFLLPRLLKKKQIHVVHELSHIGPFLWKDTPYKKIMTIHDLTPILFPEFHVPQGHILQRFLLPHFMRVVDKVITVSAATAHDIKQVYGRVQNVYPILLASRFAPLSFGTKKKNNEILCVGTIEPRKNVPTLIKAFEHLKAAGFTGSLRLIGKKGWKCEDVFTMIDQSLWKDDIIWEGYVTSERMQEAYESAEIFVYPSVYEGFGLPVLEAMQYGLPVLAGNNSSIPEVLGDAGVLCDVHSDEVIFEELKKLLIAPHADMLRKELGKKAYERARLFSWDIVASKTIQVYEGK